MLKINYYAYPGIRRVDIVKKNINSNHIISVISDYFSISRNKLEGKLRHREVTYARHICMYVMKQYTSMSLKSIAATFGGRHHTTTLHSIRLIEDFVKIKDDMVLEDLKKINVLL